MTDTRIKLTPAFKKKIKEDWHSCLPGLTIEKTFNMSRLVGPLLITLGFDVKSNNDCYFPGFSVHNLSRESEHVYAALNTELRNAKGADDWVDCRWHEGKYVEAAERMKQQALLPLEGPVSLKMIIQAYQNYVNSPTVGYQPHLLEDPALIAAWAGQLETAKQALEWGADVLRTKYNVSNEAVLKWKHQLEERIAHPETIRTIAEQEIIKHKLTHIPQEELVIDS